MKICILAFSHPYSDGRINNREAKSLKNFGHEITIIARPIGFEMMINKQVDGLNYFTLPLRPYSRLRQLFFDPYHMFKLLLLGFQIKCDIYLCHEPQSLIVGLILARVRKVKVIYDCHEYQPESYADHMPRGLYEITKKILLFIEGKIVKFTDGVITVNEDLGSRFNRHNNNVIVLQNYPRQNMFQSHRKHENQKIYVDKKKTIIYVGSINKERGIETCIKITSKIKPLIPSIELIIIGDISEDYKKYLEQMTSKLSIKNEVKIMGYVPYEEVPEYLYSSNLGLLLLSPEIERYKWSEPIKFFEYSASYLPIVVSNLNSLRNLISIARNGIVIDINDVNEAVKEIVYLLNDENLLTEMGIRGREAFDNYFCWEKIESKLLDLFPID